MVAHARYTITQQAGLRWCSGVARMSMHRADQRGRALRRRTPPLRAAGKQAGAAPGPADTQSDSAGLTVCDPDVNIRTTRTCINRYKDQQAKGSNPFGARKIIRCLTCGYADQVPIWFRP